MDKRLKVNFVPFSNFGDTSVPYMLKKLNIPFIFAHHTVEKKIIMTGSILNGGSRKDTIVWGSGVMYSYNNGNTESIYKGVRGYKTLEILKKQGIDTSNIALGDPAILLSRIYKPKILDKKYKLGIIPHIVDFNIVQKHIINNKEKFKNTTVINPQVDAWEVESFIDKVNECEGIVSTCLHGIICANSYNIKASWMKVSNNLMGDDVKFQDYFSTVLPEKSQPIPLIDSEKLNISGFSINIDIDKLWEKRPWIDISDDYFVDIDDEQWKEKCYPIGYSDRIWGDEFFIR